MPPPGWNTDTVPTAMNAKVVVVLFTDIEGSTALWEHHRAAMRGAVARHDEIVREEVSAAGGRVVKGMGDGFMVEFGSPERGLEAAVAIQTRLSADGFADVGGLAVRMGLHAGEADVRDGDLFGAVVNKAARLVAAASGGQIVLSQAVLDRLTSGLSGPDELRDLGRHLFKGLDAPETVYQLVHPGLPDEFPPLNTLGRHETNLPAQLTEFIGRETELAEVVAGLGGTRLLTLIGPGGVGKTRLALHAGAELVDDYANGVWLVELAPLRAGDVPRAVAAVLGVEEVAGTALTTTIAGALSDKPTLLLLDNFEHVLEAAPHMAALLKLAPGLRVLATSRAPLGIPGEGLYQVPPLSTTGEHPSAVELFERLVATSGRALRFPERAVAGEICRMLDGLPLAISLVAPRARLLPLARLRDRLAERLELVSGISESGLDHHRSVEAATSWSHELLDEPARILFGRLSVFAGSFDLEAAESVCGFEPVDQSEVLELVAQLGDQSLVLPLGPDSGDRFRMLETVRRFAADRLSESGELVQTRSCYARYYASMADEMEALLAGPDQVDAAKRLTAEGDNIRSALRHAVGDDPATALRIAAGVWPLWSRQWSAVEALELIDLALEVAPAEQSVAKARALADRAALTMSVLSDRQAAERLIREAREMNIALGDPWTGYKVASLDAQLASIDRRIGDSMAHLGESVSELERAGAGFPSRAVRNLAVELADNGHLERAKQLVAQLEQGAAAASDAWGLEAAKYVRSRIAFYEGDLDLAFETAAEARDGFRALGILRDQPVTYTVMAFAASARGHADQVEDLARQGEELLQQLGYDFSFACFGVARAGARLRYDRRASSLEAMRQAYRDGAGELCQELRVLDLAAMMWAHLGDDRRAAQVVATADAFHAAAGTSRVPIWEQYVAPLRALEVGPVSTVLADVPAVTEEALHSLGEALEVGLSS